MWHVISLLGSLLDVLHFAPNHLCILDKYLEENKKLRYSFNTTPDNDYFIYPD